MPGGEIIYSQSEKNDFKGTLYKHIHYWYLYLVSIILFLSLALLYLRYATPEYLISSSLLIRDIDKGPDFQSGNPVFKDLDIFNSATSIENEIESLKSITLMQRVLTELSLQASFYTDGFLKKREIYGNELPIGLVVNEFIDSAFENEINIQIKNNNEFVFDDNTSSGTTYRFGQTITKAYGSFIILKAPISLSPQPKKVYITFHNLRDLATEYSKDLTVAQVNKKANALTVSMLHPIPEKGRAILNKLIDVYNKENKEDRNLLATNTIAFIDNRLKDLTTDLSNIEKSVELFKRRNQVTDVRSEASAYLEESRNYTNQLSALNIQLDIVESLERYLTQQKAQFDLVPSNLRIDDPTLLEFIVKFNDLQLQRERLLRTAEPSNPLVININEQLTSLRANILENLRTIRRGLLVTRGNLSTKANSFQSRITQVPNIERELNSINRQEGVKRDLYVYLLQKREESSLSLASAVSNTRIIDPALSTKKPINPKKPVIFGIALLLGLLIPFGFIFITSFFKDNIHTKKDVTRASLIPILGEIGHYRKKGYLAISYKKKTPIIEQFRLIRGNLYHAIKGKENQVILITSCIENEGRTFFSINLAASLSSAGKKVVLLDFNFRKPGVLSGLDLQNELGISDFLNSTHLSVDDLIKYTIEVPELSVIGTGPIPINPTEFMLNPRVGQFIADLKVRFDHIVIDSAPIGQVADTFSLAPYTDVTIFIVRYNHTPKVQLDTLNGVFSENKLKNPFIVLNDARKFNNLSIKKTYGLKS